MTDLDAARTLLEERRAELLARHSRVSRHTRHRDEPLPADFAEQAVELGNGETLVALDHELEAELRRIERALVRIASGEYPSCERCGAEIGDARLATVPDTALCIDCASLEGRRQ